MMALSVIYAFITCMRFHPARVVFCNFGRPRYLSIQKMDMNNALLFPFLTFPPSKYDAVFPFEPVEGERVVEFDYGRQAFIAFPVFNVVIEELQNGRVKGIMLPEPGGIHVITAEQFDSVPGFQSVHAG